MTMSAIRAHANGDGAAGLAGGGGGGVLGPGPPLKIALHHEQVARWDGWRWRRAVVRRLVGCCAVTG
jgi:hypothetical protein